MKFFKGTVIGLVVLTFLWMIYFATQVSATYPPIKTYDYSLTDKELYLELVDIISNNPAWTILVTDSTGDKDNRKYYCKLIKKTPTDSLTFSVFFQKTDHLFDKKTKSEIGLVGAWDNIRWTGGYKIDDPNVGTLLILFENDIINELETNTIR